MNFKMTVKHLSKGLCANCGEEKLFSTYYGKKCLTDMRVRKRLENDFQITYKTKYNPRGL